jgi:signal transduction histidine kinase
MDQRLKRWTPRLLLFSALAVLLAVGVLQQQWFGRSAAMEIENSLRGLESGVRQSVFREFQRYAPVVTAARDMQARGETSDSAYRVFVSGLWSTYGPAGTAPGLLAGAGLWRPGHPALVNTGGVWAEVPEAPWMDKAAHPSRPPVAFGAADPPEAVLVLRPEHEGSPVLLLYLDLESFFSAYVKPAVDDMVPGGTVAWQYQRREPGREAAFDSDHYAFNPLTALLGMSSVPPVLSVSVSRFLGPANPDFRFPAAWVLTIALPSEAPVLGVERRLAWNWLGAVVLLAVLAAAFALAMGQWSRLAELRQRERDFMASVSHELRTPLTVIRSAADNFTRGIVPAERQGRYARLILDQSVRLGRMIEEMLTFAQTETSPLPGHDVVDFDLWLAELRPPLEAVAAERGVELAWDAEAGHGRTDPEALRMIVENLVVNALNHAYPSESRRGAVRVSLKRRLGRLELAVEDDGRGIAPQESRKVFEPFYRDQFSRSHQEKGSGLGLFLAQRQAKRLGGSLRLESPWRRAGARHSGCRFTLDVPVGMENDDGR